MRFSVIVSGVALLALPGCGGGASLGGVSYGGGDSYAMRHSVSWQEMTYDVTRGKQLLQADRFYYTAR